MSPSWKKTLDYIFCSRSIRSDEELMQRALQKGVKLNSLSAYYHDSPDDFAAHTFIINYSYLNTTGVEDAIKVLYDVIKK